MNLADNLVRTAHARPDQVAILLDDQALTYDELNQRSTAVAGRLAERGVRAGDRVGLMLPNLPEWAAIYYGILRLGGVAVPMNPLFKEREVAYYLQDSGTRLLFAWEGMAEEANAGAKLADVDVVALGPGVLDAWDCPTSTAGEVVAREPADTAVILYTSGTTGQPKGAELTHANLVRNTEISAKELIGITHDDVVFGGLPLFHVFGQTCGLNAAVAAGATLTMLPRFDPAKALEVLARDKVTVFEGVPTMYGAILNHPDRPQTDLSALRVGISGGAALLVELLHAFEQTLGCVVLEGYGLSETSPVACFNKIDGRKPGSIGTPISGVELGIVDDDQNPVPAGERGEIVIRGHNVMKGYWGKREATDEAIKGGWFHTGDIGVRDDEGYYFIVDRLKDLIIRGGYNIYPREIEEVLYEHPAVAEAAVIGVAHAELGEEVAAVVVLKPGTTATADALHDHVKAQVAAYKYPRSVHIVEVLPKTATGKILKRDITVDIGHEGTGQ